MSLCTFRRTRASAPLASSAPAAEPLASVSAGKWPAEWAETTRLMWEKLHRHAMRSSGKSQSEWLNAWAAQLPCAECRHHWNALVLQSPPDWERFFVWTIACHNRVNEALNKPVWTLKQALARWGS
jgi:hypothetical protein